MGGCLQTLDEAPASPACLRLSLARASSRTRAPRPGRRRSLEACRDAGRRVKSLGEGDEVAGNPARALVDELIEGVLAVRSRFAPVEGRGLIIDLGPVERDVLAVALHSQLLQIRGKSLQVLLIGKDRERRCTEEVGVPDTEETHENGKVLFERAVRNARPSDGTRSTWRGSYPGRWPASSRVRSPSHGVASADPIPEFKHIGSINAELRNLGRIGRDRNKMPRD